MSGRSPVRRGHRVITRKIHTTPRDSPAKVGTDKYVTGGTGADGAFLSANGASAAEESQFAVFGWGEGIVTLRSAANDKYVGIAGGQFRNDQAKPNGWFVQQQFKLEEQCDGTYVIRYAGYEKAYDWSGPNHCLTVAADGKLTLGATIADQAVSPRSTAAARSTSGCCLRADALRFPTSHPSRRGTSGHGQRHHPDHRVGRRVHCDGGRPGRAAVRLVRDGGRADVRRRRPKVTQASHDYYRPALDAIGTLIVGRHVFDMTDGWGGKPPAGDQVVVVSHRPAPDGWDPAAPFHFVDGVADAVALAQDLAGDRVVSVAAGDVGGQVSGAGLVDEVALDVVPVVFGTGKRYFGSLSTQVISRTRTTSSRATASCTCASASGREGLGAAHARRGRSVTAHGAMVGATASPRPRTEDHAMLPSSP